MTHEEITSLCDRVIEHVQARYSDAFVTVGSYAQSDAKYVYLVASGKPLLLMIGGDAEVDNATDAFNAAGGYASHVRSLADVDAVLEAAGVSTSHSGPPRSLRDFSQLYYLKKEIKDSERRLAELKAQEGAKASRTDKVVVSGGEPGHGQAEDLAIEIAYLEHLIAKSRHRAVCETVWLLEYISGVEDSLVRQILIYRFVDCHKWDKVAMLIGGNNTPASVSQCCYRYIKKLKHGRV